MGGISGWGMRSWVLPTCRRISHCLSSTGATSAPVTRPSSTHDCHQVSGCLAFLTELVPQCDWSCFLTEESLQKQLEILRQRPSPTLFQRQVALSKVRGNWGILSEVCVYITFSTCVSIRWRLGVCVRCLLRSTLYSSVAGGLCSVIAATS